MFHITALTSTSIGFTWLIVHHEIRRPDGVIVIHHELVVIQSIADFSQDLSPHQCPVKELQSDDTHRIVTGRWFKQGGFVSRHFVPLPDNHCVQQHRFPVGSATVARIIIRSTKTLDSHPNVLDGYGTNFDEVAVV